MVGLLVDWLVGWFVGWLVGLLVDWVVGSRCHGVSRDLPHARLLRRVGGYTHTLYLTGLTICIYVIYTYTNAIFSTLHYNK